MDIFKYLGKTVTDQNFIREKLNMKFGYCLVLFSLELFVFSSAVK
jgi:hypothetical protein